MIYAFSMHPMTLEYGIPFRYWWMSTISLL